MTFMGDPPQEEPQNDENAVQPEDGEIPLVNHDEPQNAENAVQPENVEIPLVNPADEPQNVHVHVHVHALPRNNLR